MSTHQRTDLILDPERPGRLRAADRLSYALGVLLDSDDFEAEQSYHRGRLARALAYLFGSGTVAGLEAHHEEAVEPGDDEALPRGREERLRVAPGLALDRLGRLIELEASSCLPLDAWWNHQAAGSDRSRALARAFDGDTDAVVADLFLTFRPCPRGATPAFAAGPLDATDATTPSRLRDGHLVELVPRSAADGGPARPVSRWRDVDPDGADPRRALQEAILAGWREGSTFFDQRGRLAGPEHPRGVDPTSVLLARIRVPAAAPADPDTAPERTEGAVTIDNFVRRFVVPADALAHLAGFGPREA